MDDRAALAAAQKYPDPDHNDDDEEVGPRGERPQQTAAAAGEASASAGTDLAPGHDDAGVASTQSHQPDTATAPTPTHADAKEGHESDQHDPSRHHHLSSTATLPAAPAVAPGATTTAGSPADVPTAAAAPPPHFVAPSSYLRPLSRDPFARSPSASGPTPSPSGQQKKVQMVTPVDREQIEGLRAIRAFLKVRTSYDVLPLSYRLIVFDTGLLVKKSLNTLVHQGIVSAPLWDSQSSTFAGLLTTSDYLNVVQYYWQNPDALAQVDQFKLNSLRDIERAIGVAPIETVSINPNQPLYDACRRMLQSRARRIPLIDVDDETQREMVVSVVTQYRILKFVSVNVKETQSLKKPLWEIGVGTFENLATATMDTPVMDVIHMLVKRDISSVPILDRDGTVLNVFEAVDVIALIKGGDYENLNLSVGKALEKRSEDFPGIYTCTLNDRLDTVFDTIRKSRVHRLVIIDERSQLKGLMALSDILDYTLNSPLDGDGEGQG
ncbi:CBS-domain-containing protein [Hortaea werneckii]|uniref:CBS domain-containing protein n=1 Tax=Hortaea werneckii TaxID=91943 RepID=A0A3M7I859_HORWE|nr:CBS-domain-containing protein [Hortaea werneckii]KAI6821564.1 CBS-domain-containing protein [Hortaea werneckii]KAI6918386.1 CBS-domain-containing protein [Hortaea werneckii]KAI6929016.1 CBS-domain-containing protein [Hortaea werneckii]KAI6964362.1 CBS-domain-containing protein [Hortaea werneckii]